MATTDLPATFFDKNFAVGAGDLEKVLDQAVLSLGVFNDRMNGSLRLAMIEFAILEESRPSEYRVERRS